MKPLTQLFLFLLLMVITPFLNAETYHVDQNHPQANDNNPGTASLPFLTVQKGLNSTIAGDTLFVRNGYYLLEGFTKDFDYRLCILGEHKDSTVFDSIGTLNIIAGTDTALFTLRNISFSNYERTVLNFVASAGDTLRGVTISDCIFESIERTQKSRVLQARYDVAPEAVIMDVNIYNCDFLGLTAPGVKYIYLYEGMYSHINICNNNFYDMVSNSNSRGVIAINVGTNSNLPFNHDILISGNHIDGIVTIDTGAIEAHAILTYGENISIINNSIRDMVPGEDREAIYMKGSYSVIANNVLLNCSSHQGAIAIKGSGKSFYDTIRDNRIQSHQSGRSIYTAGPEFVTMKDNYVKNTDSSSTDGLYIYGANMSNCYQQGNYVQTARNGAYMHDVGGGWISANTLIAYDGLPVALTGTTANVLVTGNIEETGWPEATPLAVASGDTISGTSPLQVNFSSTGSYDPNGVIHSFAWNFHDGNTSYDINPAHTFTEARTHAVTLIVTDADGYKDMACVIIRVDKAEELIPVSIDSHTQDALDLSIYPNPFSELAHIDFALSANYQLNIDVFDLKGSMIKCIFNGNLNPGKHKMAWDGRDERGYDVPAGIYFIRCSYGDRIAVKQLILLK